eukprot:3572343-Prymnesium_polylepis.1
MPEGARSSRGGGALSPGAADRPPRRGSARSRGTPSGPPRAPPTAAAQPARHPQSRHRRTRPR